MCNFGKLICPRCLVADLNADLKKNPTSQFRTTVHICSDCAFEEAMINENKLPPSENHISFLNIFLNQNELIKKKVHPKKEGSTKFFDVLN